ncbi:hypothetical protein ACFLUO_10200 [Chloroflexota bacterium]
MTTKIKKHISILFTLALCFSLVGLIFIPATPVGAQTDGPPWAWGGNYSGELGGGTRISRSTPVQVSGLTGVIAIDGGSNHSLALKRDYERTFLWER